MKTAQLIIGKGQEFDFNFNINPQLILAFGQREFLENSNVLQSLKDHYPEVVLAGCTTSGEIAGE